MQGAQAQLRTCVEYAHRGDGAKRVAIDEVNDKKDERLRKLSNVLECAKC